MASRSAASATGKRCGTPTCPISTCRRRRACSIPSKCRPAAAILRSAPCTASTRRCPRRSRTASPASRSSTTAPTTAAATCVRASRRRTIRSPRRARCIRSSARTPTPGGACSISGGAATLIWSGSSLRNPRRCSTSSGASSIGRNSPGGTSGASAISCCGTIAAPCTGATHSIPTAGGSCTAPKSKATSGRPDPRKPLRLEHQPNDGRIMRRRDFLALGVAALAARSLTLQPAFAQSKYPDRPIRLVIPFPPGGGYDAVGRPWAEKMKSVLGTVVVENQGGVGSSLGAAAVARARPDGYTILLGGSSTHVTEAILKRRPLYDPLKELEPISNVVVAAFALAINPAVPARTLREFIDYAKANPGKLSYGHAGVGSLNHLTGELLKSLAGTDIVHVPYRGSGPATADTISGQVAMVTPAVTGPLLEFNRTGKLRILAVTSPKRLIAAPDIPTAVEAGLPGMISQQLIGLFAPSGTPKAIIEQISQATRTAIAETAYRQMLIESGFEPDVDSTPEKFRRFIEEDIARWSPLVKAIGLKLD